MRWHHQLRWKLFISHLVIFLIAVVILLATANFLASRGLIYDMPLTMGAAASETGQLGPDTALEGPWLQLFQAVVQQALLVASFAALVAAVVVSLFVSHRIVEPLHAISTVSQRLAQGFYRERTLIGSDDELAELSRNVNQLAETLEQTEHRRIALLADVAHELRTPLSTIEGYMEGLIDGVIRPNRETFALVLSESVRLQRLIEDLMLLSRAEAGQIPIVPCPVDLRAMLENLVAQFQPQFAVDQVSLDLVIAPDLPPAWADPDRVNQVLINLLANAFRYTPGDGQVTLRAQANAGCLLVTVQDTGVGIDPQHLAHLFERFYRVDKSRARASGGNGIGLTIARHLVYAQGGEIWAESRGKGHGSSFHFTLPVDTSTADDMDDDPPQMLPAREQCVGYKRGETVPLIEGYSAAAGDG
jgi:signal transduction histidine kinase